VGDKAWKDYEASVDVCIPDKGFAGLYGRIDSAMSRYMPGGYGLMLDSAGTWQLKDTIFLLESGKVAITPGTWHNLKLRFSGVHVIAEIDGQAVCTVMDDFHATGAVALAGSYSSVEFDNLTIEPFKGHKPESAAGWDNLALGKKATAASQAGEGNNAVKATDGNHATGWSPAAGKTAGEWLQVDFGEDTTFDRVIVDQHVLGFGYAGGITGYKIQCWSDGAWKDIAAGKNMNMRQTDDFAPVTGRKVRLLITACSEKTCVYEFKAYRRHTVNDSLRPAARDLTQPAPR